MFVVCYLHHPLAGHPAVNGVFDVARVFESNIVSDQKALLMRVLVFSVATGARAVLGEIIGLIFHKILNK